MAAIPCIDYVRESPGTVPARITRTNPDSIRNRWANFVFSMDLSPTQQDEAGTGIGAWSLWDIPSSHAAQIDDDRGEDLICVSIKDEIYWLDWRRFLDEWNYDAFAPIRRLIRFGPLPSNAEVTVPPGGYDLSAVKRFREFEWSLADGALGTPGAVWDVSVGEWGREERTTRTGQRRTVNRMRSKISTHGNAFVVTLQHSAPEPINIEHYRAAWDLVGRRIRESAVPRKSVSRVIPTPAVPPTLKTASFLFFYDGTTRDNFIANIDNQPSEVQDAYFGIGQDPATVITYGLPLERANPQTTKITRFEFDFTGAPEGSTVSARGLYFNGLICEDPVIFNKTFLDADGLYDFVWQFDTSPGTFGVPIAPLKPIFDRTGFDTNILAFSPALISGFLTVGIDIVGGAHQYFQQAQYQAFFFKFFVQTTAETMTVTATPIVEDPIDLITPAIAGDPFCNDLYVCELKDGIC